MSRKEDRIRLCKPLLEEEDFAQVVKVLRSGQLVQGAQVADFEAAVAAYLDVQHAVAVSSGTAALHVAMAALGVGSGDLVVTTAYSWISTANVVELLGATPLFVDIDPITYNICPDALCAALEKHANRSLKAILPVHAFGLMADMAAILDAAHTYGLPVVEDAACALGAVSSGKAAGTWGTMGCFSFHPRKTLTTGEGGLVCTDDSALAEKLRTLRDHGKRLQQGHVDFVVPGFNYRMTEFQAALGTAQIKRHDRALETRKQIARNYEHLLEGLPLQLPHTPDSTTTAQSYVVLLAQGVDRDKLIRGLALEGVETAIGTYALPMTEYYRRRYKYEPRDFPATTDVAERALALPLHNALTEEEQARVVAEITRRL